MRHGLDFGARTRPLAIAIAVATMAALSATGPALGQGTDDTSEGVRAGWTLHASEAPAFSIQLPPGWDIDPASDGLLGATGPDGETLVVRLDENATGESLDSFAKQSGRAIKDELEALVGDGRLSLDGRPVISTVFRQAASGLVARLDGPSGQRMDDPTVEEGQATARFLVPPCEDGARTLEITGPALEPQPDGAPDAWDSIAASVSPCSSGASPELVLDPAVTALRAAYWAMAQDINPPLVAAFDELGGGGTAKKWTKDSVRIADLYDDQAERILDLPWTTETRPLAEAVAAKYDEASTFFRKTMARAISDRAFRTADKENTRIQASTTEAVNAARMAIGLPTVG
jgi:hypothetical protein